MVCWSVLIKSALETLNMDDDIAERLREENPEQFFILVRMHLSFIIDMNTDEWVLFSWILYPLSEATIANTPIIILEY